MSTDDAQGVQAAFRCLVADDSEFARGNIARVIEKLGGAVVGEAAGGLEAVALFAPTMASAAALIACHAPETRA